MLELERHVEAQGLGGSQVDDELEGRRQLDRQVRRPFALEDSSNVDTGGKTAALSRDHTIHVDDSGLLTIAGGKWTTYRHMAEDCVDHAITLGRLDEKPCVTRNLHIHGYREETDDLGPLWVYGSDAASVQAIAASDASLAAPLDSSLPYIGAEVVWAAREEMARTVDDVLSRRTRALFLNARAAQRMIEPVAALLARELGRDDAWKRNQIASASALAEKYVVPLKGKST